VQNLVLVFWSGCKCFDIVIAMLWCTFASDLPPSFVRLEPPES
jgi:hypothetical protein